MTPESATQKRLKSLILQAVGDVQWPQYILEVEKPGQHKYNVRHAHVNRRMLLHPYDLQQYCSANGQPMAPQYANKPPKVPAVHGAIPLTQDAGDEQRQWRDVAQDVE